MKKIKKRKTLKKSVGSKNLFFRALGSASAGLPISYGLNILILIPLVVFMRENYDDWLIAAVVAIPFFWASIARMYTIDFVWFKYKINIDPKHLIQRLYNGFEKHFVEYVIEGTGIEKTVGDFSKLPETSGTKRVGLQSLSAKLWGHFIQPKSSVHVRSGRVPGKVRYDKNTGQSDENGEPYRP